MKYHEMSKNYIFREFECGLTKEQTAELCFKSVRTITEWDKGKAIPPECRRLMRMYSGRDVFSNEDWIGFRLSGNRIILPTGYKATAQEIILGIALIEIQCTDDLNTMRKLLKYARKLQHIMKKKGS
ncbi:regulator [Vibrio fluvialis]|uniref:regulator n=1 Tax=Vibrio fluvialis TaxID=676 RepID=UPI0028DD8F5F|nr:regulator [Vibrio fluvialis]MDT8868713.1 regulator [Vibrio fluvialis]MDT8876366.1 regulator [Vibrio fluvialis]